MHVSTPSYQIRALQAAAHWQKPALARSRSCHPVPRNARIERIYPPSRLTAHDASDDTYTYTYTTPDTMTTENTEPIPVPPPVTDTPATIEPTPAATTAAVVSEPEPTPAATASEPTPAPVAEAAAKSEGAFPD